MNRLLRQTSLWSNLERKRAGKHRLLYPLCSGLQDDGFLSTDKRGKERIYYPLISKDEYLKFETSNFMKQYHDNSFLDLVNTLYEDKALTDKDIDELLQWAKKRRD